MFMMRFDMRAPEFGSSTTELYATALEMASFAESRGHCPLAHRRRLGSSPDVDSRVTPNGTCGIPSASGSVSSWG
jgi:hypothetical protein